MSPKRGQPPKPPEEKKNVNKNVAFTKAQIAVVEQAKEVESPESKISTYIREVVVDHAERITKKKSQK